MDVLWDRMWTSNSTSSEKVVIGRLSFGLCILQENGLIRSVWNLEYELIIKEDIVESIESKPDILRDQAKEKPPHRTQP